MQLRCMKMVLRINPRGPFSFHGAEWLPGDFSAYRATELRSKLLKSNLTIMCGFTPTLCAVFSTLFTHFT